MRIKVFIGPTQTKIPVDIAVCLQSFGADAEYVRLDASGHNALDFHLAFYLGELVAGDAAGYFHIISRDTGFDPLVRHLQARKVSIQRYCDTIEIPFLKIAGAKTLPERIELILEKLCKQKTNRPSTTKTLKSSLNTLFQKQLSEAELTDLLEELVRRKLIAVAEEKVIYHLPDGGDTIPAKAAK